MTSPQIHPPFRDLIPPLTADEREHLEAELVAHGCREPLVVWRDFLIDGHNRLEICTRLGLPYEVVDYSLSSLLLDEASVMQWICDNQLARRNLTPFQASYLRGKRYLLMRVTRVQVGQSGRPGESGYRIDPGAQRGERRALVAAESGVGARTITRDFRYAEAVDAIATSAGLDVRNAVLRGDVRITRRAIADVAQRAPATLDQLRLFVAECRRTRPSQRTPDDDTRWFQRNIREFVYEGEGDERRIVKAKLSCGHVEPHRARRGDVTKSKTKSCSQCGSGNRASYERGRERAVFERAVQAAMIDARKRIALVDLVQASCSMLTFVPQREQHVEVLGRIDLSAGILGLLEAPAGSER